MALIQCEYLSVLYTYEISRRNAKKGLQIDIMSFRFTFKIWILNILFDSNYISLQCKTRATIDKMETKVTIIVLLFLSLQIVNAPTSPRPVSTNTHQNSDVNEEEKKLKKFLSALSGNIRPGLISNMRLNAIGNNKRLVVFKIKFNDWLNYNKYRFKYVFE